jgi:hypothetical protein
MNEMMSASATDGLNFRAIQPKVDNVPKFVPTVAECDLPLEACLATARAKLDLSMVLPGSVQQNEAMFAETVMYQLGSFGRRFSFGPQLCQSTPLETPEGFALNVSPNAPVFPLPFSERALYNGIIAIPLTELAHSTQASQLSLQFFADPKNRVRENLLEQIRNDEDLGVGDESNFAGFFSSTQRGKAPEYWCVVQCHSSRLSREAYDMICAAEPESIDQADSIAREMIRVSNEYKQREHTMRYHTLSVDLDKPVKSASEVGRVELLYITWEQLFVKTPRMHEIRKEQREHRMRVMKKTLAIVGIDTRTMPALALHIDSPFLREVPSFNTVDKVDKNEPRSDLCYLSRMASVHSVGRHGTVFCEAPFIGPVILGGPWDINRVIATNKDNPRSSFIGVPVGTGTILSQQRYAAARFTPRTDTLQTQTHVWSPNAAVEHPIFDVRNTISRANSAEWTSFLYKCGHTNDNELPLNPICVRWTTPTPTPPQRQ